MFDLFGLFESIMAQITGILSGLFSGFCGG